MTHSSYVAYYLFKLWGVGALALALALLHDFVFPEAVYFDDLGPTAPAFEMLYAALVIPFAVAVAFFMFFRIRVIRYDDTVVEIINGSDCVRSTWADVRSVSKVFGCAPPLYRMTFRNNEKPAYFIMSMFCVYAFFWSWDFTGFYPYAKRKIGENARE